MLRQCVRPQQPINQFRSDCSSPAGLLVATADSDPGSADTDADGGNDGHADANANTGSASSDAHANTDARDTADAHIDAGADADTSSADSDAHADADADAGTGSGSADSDAANGGIDMDAPSAVPRAAEPSPAPPGWRAISLEDGVTMYRNLTSGALSLSARDDGVLSLPPPPVRPSTQLSASCVSRISRATDRLARWLSDLRPTLPTARSPNVPAALPASGDSAASAQPPQDASDDVHLELPTPSIPIHPRVADVIQRFRDGRLHHPPDILRPSERSYSLGVAVGLGAMKQRGHQDHLLGSSERMPPTFPPTALASDASITATADWLLDAAIHAPPSHTELPHITGPAHVMGEQGLAIADLPDWFRALDKRQRANTPSPCRASATPPRPYERRPDPSVRLRTLLQLLCRGAKPILSSAVDGATRVRIRRTGDLRPNTHRSPTPKLPRTLVIATFYSPSQQLCHTFPASVATSRNVSRVPSWVSSRPSPLMSGAHAPGRTSSISVSTRSRNSFPTASLSSLWTLRPG